MDQSKLDFTDIGLFLNVESTHCRYQKCPANQKCVVTLSPTVSASYNIPTGYMGFKKEEKCYCDDGTEGNLFLYHLKIRVPEKVNSYWFVFWEAKTISIRFVWESVIQNVIKSNM